MSEATHSLDPDALRQLQSLARRLQDNRAFMAYVLAAYQEQEGLDDAGLIERLGITPAMLARLALCRRPDAGSPQFADQIRQIAAYTQTDAGQLAMILRQVGALETLATRPETADAPEADRHALQLRPGLLAAARDRGESDEYRTSAPDEPEREEDEPEA